MAALNGVNGDGAVLHSRELTIEHDELLRQFRVNVADILLPEHDDHYLLKWLKARKYNLKQAEKMLRDHIIFREKWKVDYLANEWNPPEVLRLYMAGGHFGFDKDGRPVFYQGLGTFDTYGILHSASRQDILRYTIRICEDIQRAIREQRNKHDKFIENITLIVDMDNVGAQIIWRPFLNIYSEMLKMFEANYPETLHSCFVINAPAIFTTAYNLVKHFLSDDTRGKINVVGRCYRHVLLSKIASAQLPVHYGGSAMTEDGNHKCGICFGGKIPTSYYLNNEQTQGKFSDIHISRGSAIQLAYDIHLQGTILRWEFLTGKNDVEFSVQYKETGTEEETTSPIVTKKRICSNFVPEAGGITCDQPGQYIIEFSNNYSWFRSKKVSYFIDIIHPEETDR
ncbi:SEC14-like protein 2 [Amphiura filiformis]|uniref:SEC14-like protein 2 n=1 Tax=Amphiura filiformis TaxID=82378 RepID=UPI003B21119D